MDFGRMPISNRFLRADEFDDEFFYDLSVVFCPSCYMVQLGDRVAPEMMFNEDYAYFSSISTAMAQHFEALAEEISATVADKPSPLVVELGCNDGIMLQHIARREIRHVGIEPSANVAAAARKKGITVSEKFFGLDSAREIERSLGQADVICGANVMCHIEEINSVMAGVAALLRDDGLLFFEDPYLLDIIRQTSFD
ncbi:MAG TPA: methyltransferase domain-containing protein, partial [Acidobacteriota bacterium]|nr:methyltransferase domain-containing protein [Acidobacteriota bacterium]